MLQIISKRILKGAGHMRGINIFLDQHQAISIEPLFSNVGNKKAVIVLFYIKKIYYEDLV